MRTIFTEYNPGRNSIDVYTSADYMLRIDCWEAEKNLRTTPGSDCALNTLAIDEPLEYARLYLDQIYHTYPVLKEIAARMKLEPPCSQETDLFDAAISAAPDKIIVKRPLKSDFLAGRKPSYTLSRKAIRYDCYTL